MKVLFLTRMFYPHIGGLEKHIEKVSELLIKKGYGVTIVTTKHDDLLPDRETYKRIKILRFVQPEIKFVGLIYTWFWLVKHIALIKQSDVIHVHDVFIWYWPFKILIPKKKVYLTFHGRWGKYPIPIIDAIQKRIGARFSDGVMCIGDYILKNYGIKSDIVSYGATDIPKGKFKKDDKLVLYVGRLDKDIALHTFFEVFKRLNGYKIVFCGGGELSYEASLYGKVVGFVDPAPFYKKAKYCFASGYLTIMEALANRCLVFTAYDNPLQKDYYELAPFRKFIVCSMNPNEIYEKFMYYEKNFQAAKKITSKGYEWVRKQTWETMVENYYKLWGGRR